MEQSKKTDITTFFEEQPNSPFFEVDKISIKENPIRSNSFNNNYNNNNYSNNSNNIWQSLFFWLGILILLAFLGFNIFTFFGDTSDFFGETLDYIKDFLNPILKFFGFTILETSKQTIKTSDIGAKGLIDNISSFALSGIDSLESNIGSPVSNKSSKKSENNITIEEKKVKEKKNLESEDKKELESNNTIEKPPVLSDKGKSSSSNENESITSTKFKIGNSLPEPDSKTVDFFSNTIKSGKGVCHIGTVNGVRGCLEIDEVSNCPRGFGYVSMSVCREPTLRN